MLSAWMRAHLSQIAFSVTAMLLVLGGPYINGLVKNVTKPLHWLVRYALFVLLSTVGYGLITNLGLQSIRALLARLDSVQLIAAVFGAHLVLAWFLKRERKI
jgi:hypothetical protein